MNLNELGVGTGGAPRAVAPGRKRAPLTPVSRDGELPLSFMQQRLWFLAQLEGSASTYNVHFFVRLKGALDVPALRRSLGDIVQRHESLRTTFAEVAGRPVQRIVPDWVLPVPVEDLESLPVAEREAAVRQRAEEEARYPFHLEHGPLTRATLLRVAAEDHVLLFVTHHIVCDAVSLAWMASELNTLYLAHTRGEAPRLPALPVQYADFAHWQREWLQGEALEAQRAWWLRRLEGAPPVLELPTDRPRPPAQTFRGAVFRMPFPPEMPAALRELGRRAGVTPYMTLLAGFQALLCRYTGQSDLVVGTPFAGRNRREVERLIGFFANTLALRLDASGDPGFQELLRRVRESSLGAFAQPDMPFEQLVDALAPVRDPSRSALFQVMFVHVSPPAGALSWPGVTVEEPTFEPGVARFDITLFLYESPGGWEARWEYNRDLFDEATVARMATHYVRLLAGAAANPEQRLSRLPLLTEAEQRRVVREWNDTAAPVPSAPGVHALFEATARRTPHDIAVRFGDAVLTYDELNRRANRVAWRLRARGILPDTPVALCVERSLELAVGVLAILKAGGAYVPLDPAYPSERLALMLQTSRASVLLTQRHLADALPASDAERLYLDADAHGDEASREDDPEPASGPDHLAYVIFTSGSTGVPKGVAMPHRQLLNLIQWQVNRSDAPRGRTLQFSAFSFDVCFQEMLPTFAAGGELVLVTEELRRDARALLKLMREREVERIFLPFVALQHLAEVAAAEDLFPGALKEINTAGEQLRITPALRRLLEAVPGCVLDNHYGPTETHAATAHVLRGSPDTWPDLPPIGRTITNARVYLLDEQLQPVPVGVPGELFIGGKQLARGYLHRPELTAERFIPDPYSPEPGARMYRTGDFARYLPGGDIEFLGRRDAQVKIRGYRIELPEVEAAIAKHPSVTGCVVEARADEGGGKRLVAYVVAKSPALGAAELRAFLKGLLPEPWVPSVWVPLDAFPLTPSGKVDRKMLPLLEGGRAVSRTFVGPRTPLELQLVRIWEELLGVHPIGVRDNFFELGGHSLLLLRLQSALRSKLGKPLPVAALFQTPTVEYLAGLLGTESSGPWSPLVELRSGDTRPFFCVHPVGGSVLPYAELARLLGPGQAFYGLQSRGSDGGEAPCDSIPEMAALYVRAVRAVQPQGPYLLGGWSMGGAIAFEMATQLQREGEQVALLALFDTAARLHTGDPDAAEGLPEASLRALFFQDLLRASGQPLPETEGLVPEARLRALKEASDAMMSAPGAAQPLRALHRVFETNLRAAWTYDPPSYTGSLTLFMASESRWDPGWESRVQGRVEVHRVPGDHYTLLNQPNVEVLAEQLRACLEVARAAPASRPERRGEAPLTGTGA